MNKLDPRPPYVWPEPRVLESTHAYEYEPPYDELARAARGICGITSAVTSLGIETLERWMRNNPELQVRLIVAVYPTCETGQEDLHQLRNMVSDMQPRLDVRVRALDLLTDRSVNTLCFTHPGRSDVYIVTGPSEDLGHSFVNGHANLVFRADAVLVERFKRYFDWSWAHCATITAEGVARIPELSIPEGSLEAAREWQAYAALCAVETEEESREETAVVDPTTGTVTLVGRDGNEVKPPSRDIGIENLDTVAERIACLYEKGMLATPDKLSRIPPLDAPVSPEWFGEEAEIQKGAVLRKVNMRVSIIDEKVLKEIEKRRTKAAPLLSKFTFGLGDSTRWMPEGARKHFEEELNRVNEEGQKLLGDLLNGDVEAFVKSHRQKLVDDINAMLKALGKPGEASEDIIAKVIQNLQNRLTKASGSTFVPTYSYARVSFAATEDKFASPWGQAFSLLTGVVTFPRKVLSDSFFLRGIGVDEDELMDAMNVADDAILQDLRARGVKDRCKRELDVLTEITDASISAKGRCELALKILDGDAVDQIRAAMQKMAAEEELTGATDGADAHEIRVNGGDDGIPAGGLSKRF